MYKLHFDRLILYRDESMEYANVGLMWGPWGCCTVIDLFFLFFVLDVGLLVVAMMLIS